MTKDEYEQQRQELLTSQLHYWKMLRHLLEKALDGTPIFEKLPTAVQAYDTVTRRELEVLNESYQFDQKLNNAPADQTSRTGS